MRLVEVAESTRESQCETGENSAFKIVESVTMVLVEIKSSFKFVNL